MTKQAQDIISRMVDALLALAATRPFSGIELKDITRAAGLTPLRVRHLFTQTSDVVTAYTKRLNTDIAKTFADGAGAGSDKDRLFDVLMERFDRMNDHRHAVQSILSAAKSDPKQMLLQLPAGFMAMEETARIAGIDTYGWRGAARLARIMGVYTYALYVWLSDDAPDLPKTMAALDTALGKAGF